MKIALLLIIVIISAVGTLYLFNRNKYIWIDIEYPHNSSFKHKEATGSDRESFVLAKFQCKKDDFKDWIKQYGFEPTEKDMDWMVENFSSVTWNIASQEVSKKYYKSVKGIDGNLDMYVLMAKGNAENEVIGFAIVIDAK